MSTHSHSHGQRGYGMVEAAFTTLLLVIIIQTLSTATFALVRSGRFGHSRLQQIADVDSTAGDLAQELQRTSSAADPVTGLPFFEVLGDPGNRRLVFRVVSSFGVTGTEVVRVWSTPIELCLENGNLVRKQDGESQILLRDVQALDFETDSLARIHCRIEARREHEQDEKTEVRDLVVPTLTSF